MTIVGRSPVDRRSIVGRSSVDRRSTTVDMGHRDTALAIMTIAAGGADDRDRGRIRIRIARCTPRAQGLPIGVLGRGGGSRS